MNTEIALKPSYWASVSGGKDSLYMLYLILHNLDKYPLDGVVHFELDIDYPFIHNIIDYVESECKRFGIRFVRIKPRKSWEELYYSVYEQGIKEAEILEWARKQPLFNHYYETNTRCGCMYCPLSSYIDYAYLLKYYPDNFEYMIERMRETERIRQAELGRPFSVISSNPKYNSDYLNNIIRTKWLGILNKRETEYITQDKTAA